MFYHLNYNRMRTLGGIRTPDLEIRRLLLCPAELLGYVFFLYIFINYRLLSPVFWCALIL